MKSSKLLAIVLSAGLAAAPLMSYAQAGNPAGMAGGPISPPPVITPVPVAAPVGGSTLATTGALGGLSIGGIAATTLALAGIAAAASSNSDSGGSGTSGTSGTTGTR